jgi:hypothetical protein
MRWLIVAAISASFMVYGQEPKAHSNADKRNTASDSDHADKASSGTVIVVNQQTPHGQENDHTAKSPGYFHELLLPQNVPNVALAIVGFIGILIAICTLRIISRQTNLMQSQFDQWVVLDNWSNSSHPRDGKLGITVELINPTEFPITLTDSSLIIGKYGDNAQSIKCLLGDKTFLPPKIPKTVDFFVRLTDTEQAAGSTAFPVTGEFYHFHKITKELVTQKLSGRLECTHWSKTDGQWHVTFTPSVHMNPEPAEKTGKTKKAN